MLELLIVISIGLTMATITVLALMPVLKQDHLDIAYDTTLSLIRTYRSQAITQSKRYVLLFTAPGTITVQYWGVGVPVSPPPVTVATYTLPSDIEFAVQTGFPNPGPDNFGNGTSALAVNACSVIGGGQPCVIFYPDGSAQDDLGNYNSGVLYLTRPSSDAYSSRAIDIYGTTGRARGWRLYNQGGANTWVQQ